MLCDKVIEQLSAFLDGELTGGETEAVRSHLATCARCRRELEDLRQTATAMSELPRVPAPPGLRAKVLSGLPAGVRPGIEEERSEPEVREERAPRWRVFWGAAAAILLAALIMVLRVPANRNPSVARAPQVATAFEPRRAAPPPAPLTGPLRGAVKGAEKSAAALDENEEGMGGATALEEKARGEAPIAKLADAVMAADAAHADVAKAGRPAIATEEIALPSANPAVAFARARALVEERGWLAPEVIEAAPAESGKADSQTPKIVLRLKRSQVPLLKDALAKAGLSAATRAQFAAQPQAGMEAARGESAAGGAARKGETSDRLGLRTKEQAKPLAAQQTQRPPPAAPAAETAPAVPPSAPSREEDKKPPSLSIPRPDLERLRLSQNSAQGSDAIALQKSLADDALVQVVLAFPRAEGAAAAKAADVKGK